MKGHLIVEVIEDSIAMELGIAVGDYLIRVDGQEIKDALDYHLLVQSEELEMTVLKKEDNEEWIFDIEKDEFEDLGLVFENNLMDEYHSCCNQCVFCFIDQLPPGMRETLYFKDDDARLSFLQGNYITMTNLKQEDVDRIIKYHLSPMNISVHTTNLELRKKMLNNRFADRIKGYMDQLYKAEILMNGQIVLCKGMNDGAELENSIKDLSQYFPHLQSLSIVPVGLSKHRNGLKELQPFSQADALVVVGTVHQWQQAMLTQHQSHFVHAGDEFYFLAGVEVPHEDTYDGYLQLENGVGMTRLLLDEFDAYYQELKGNKKKKHISIATGTLIAPVINELVGKLNKKFPNLHCHVYAITNHFFGEQITVSGLLTGQDIIKQLTGQELGSRLLLPVNLLKNGEDLLLDDTTLSQISEQLGVEVCVVQTGGNELINALLGLKE